MEQKKSLLLDVDEVICFTGFLPAVNAFLGTDYVVDDFDCYYIDEAAIPKERFQEFNSFINKRNLYDDAILIPNAIETIKDLNSEYEIYICSSCINPFDIDGSGRLFADKYNYLRQTLPFIKPENFIFTNAKHLFRADVQIDDRLPNLDSSIETKILFPSYHNKNISDIELQEKHVIRAGYDWRTGWQEVRSILLGEKEYPQEEPNKIYVKTKGSLFKVKNDK